MEQQNGRYLGDVAAALCGHPLEQAFKARRRPMAQPWAKVAMHVDQGLSASLSSTPSATTSSLERMGEADGRLDHQAGRCGYRKAL